MEAKDRRIEPIRRIKKDLWKGLALALAAFALAGCSAVSGALARSTPTPLPTIALDSGSTATDSASPAQSGGVTASGVVVPAQQAQMSFTSGGNVEMLEAEVGDQVQAGQVLARLAGAEELQAALSTAELDVLTAQQALKKLDDDLPQQQTAALQELNDARDALRDAQQTLAGFGVSSEPIDVDVARSNVALAKRALDQARKDFRPFEKKPENNLQRAALLSKLSDAQKRYDNAVEQLNRLTGILVPAFDMEQAQTDLEIAQARMKQAEENYEKIKAGPDPDQLALAQARLKNAQDQAAAARASLDDLELKAPFAGTVSQVNVHSGEWVLPGQPVLSLADLAQLRVETTDLSERDIPQVKTGQPVTVFVKALTKDVTGKVSEIWPLADTLGGDVVYKTTIDLDSIPEGLRPGMSVEVQFGTEQ
jgi:multidrug efflux pump subunit AcrA (membrane-fusion protein)